MLDFDQRDVRTTQFGIGRLDGDSRRYTLVPADGDVQEALRTMTSQTVRELKKKADSRSMFDPADKHGRREHLYVPLQDELATPLRGLHDAENLMIDSRSLDEPADAFCYFTRLTDHGGRRITGIRRAAQFKAVRRRHMLKFYNDSMRMATEPMFQLNEEFDVIVDSEFVHILNPSGFRSLAQVDATLAESVRKNISTISDGIPFADWDAVQDYAYRKPRAAALLSSIRTNRFYAGIDRTLLVTLCRNTGVEVEESDGKIIIPERSILDFLEVLDRRRYEIHVVEESAEQYRAASRRKIV